MAQEVFLTLSRDENERARLLSEYKFAADLQSRVLTAYDDGMEKGEVKGQNKILDLMDQGLSAAEIRQQLAGR
jgi:hypothetical protein